MNAEVKSEMDRVFGSILNCDSKQSSGDKSNGYEMSKFNDKGNFCL